MAIHTGRCEKLVASAFVLGATSVASMAQGQSFVSQRPTDDTRSTYSAPVGVTSDEIVAKMLERNRLRNEQLRRYSAVRTYEIRNSEGKLASQEVVRVEYVAPDNESFNRTSVEVKTYGRRVFTVDHQEYVINPANPIQDEAGGIADED